MKARWILMALLLGLTLTLLVAFACSSGDDDDDNDSSGEQFTAYLTGTMNYDGVNIGPRVLIAITDEWPMTQAPIWYDYIEVPESGFPFEYKVGLNYTGEYYVLAAIDVDPDDSVGMNYETDPLAIPDAVTDLQPGDNAVDFHFIEPGEYLDDDDTTDDDDNDNDTSPTDDDDDNDTTATTGLHGAVSYAGSATGEKVFFAFWQTPIPMSAPVHTFSFDVPLAGFPLEYEIEADFTGKWYFATYLDVDPNDGVGFNKDADPSNFKTPMASVTIVPEQSATVDVTLIDP